MGTPQWTVLSYPTISLSPGKDGFTAQPTDGVAHISVPVRSLFNGSASTLEQNQPIRLSLSATVRTDGSIAIQLL